ncbi:hypothetical protein BC830DRAFT_1097350 [Chytriomyces sp. MP71]|nr:hypothetical protein BC830DRAFT_1097350 [Chytriomyces sp. MP71]
MPNKTLVVAAIASVVIQLLLICSATATVVAKGQLYTRKSSDASDVFMKRKPQLLKSNNETASFSPCTAFCSITAFLSLPLWHDNLILHLVSVHDRGHETRVQGNALENLYVQATTDFVESLSACEQILQCYDPVKDGEEDSLRELPSHAIDAELHLLDESVDDEHMDLDSNWHEYLLPQVRAGISFYKSDAGQDVDRVLRVEKQRLIAKLRGYPDPSRAEVEDGPHRVVMKHVATLKMLSVQTVCIVVGVLILLGAAP